MTEDHDIDASALGPNMWLIDELYRRYREDPESVGPDWREFFEGFRPQLSEFEPSSPPTAQPASTQAPPVAEAKPEQRPEQRAAGRDGGSQTRDGARPLAGVAARIATNMEASLEIPTATSFR